MTHVITMHFLMRFGLIALGTVCGEAILTGQYFNNSLGMSMLVAYIEPIAYFLSAASTHS